MESEDDQNHFDCCDIDLYRRWGLFGGGDCGMVDPEPGSAASFIPIGCHPASVNFAYPVRAIEHGRHHHIV